MQFTEIEWAHYLVGLAFSDLATLNLGSRVIVGGAHRLDLAIGEIVSLASGFRAVSAQDGLEHESIEAFIGCDVRELVRSASYLRPGGSVVVTCDTNSDDRLDLYSSLHRKGLRFRSLDVQRDLVERLPLLVARFERFLDNGQKFSTASPLGHGLG